VLPLLLLPQLLLAELILTPLLLLLVRRGLLVGGLLGWAGTVNPSEAAYDRRRLMVMRALHPTFPVLCSSCCPPLPNLTFSGYPSLSQRALPANLQL